MEDDRMLFELHEERARHYAANKHLSPEDYALQIEREAAELMEQHGLTLLQTQDGKEIVIAQAKAAKIA